MKFVEETGTSMVSESGVALLSFATSADAPMRHLYCHLTPLIPLLLDHQ